MSGPIYRDPTNPFSAREQFISSVQEENARLRAAVSACERFFRETMPKINIRDSALDSNAFDAWNKAEAAIARIAVKGGAA